MTIDAVIPWVDGDDEALAAKRRKYCEGSELTLPDVGGKTRFASLGEIYWCISSINVNAPFVRRIFIVTDGQDPKVDEYFAAHPTLDHHIPVTVVDHREIFEGYEEYLPIFNSISIETMLWRIPDLSEHFLLMNDDFLITRPVTESDFFPSEGEVVCFGDWAHIVNAKVCRFFKDRFLHRSVVTFRRVTINAAEMFPAVHSASSLKSLGDRFIYLRHTPRPQLKSWYEKRCTEDPELMLRNIRHRFRHHTQYIPQELQYLELLEEGKCKVVPTKHLAFFLQPRKGREKHFFEKMERLRSGDYTFCCFNSIDLATPECLSAVLDWLRSVSFSE